MKSTALTLTSEKYFERYAKFISEADGTPQRITSPDDLDNYDVLVLSGGGDMGIKSGAYGDQTDNLPIGGVNDDRDDLEKQLLEKALERKMPVLGICRGMQVMNVFLGGTLWPDVSQGGFDGGVHRDGRQHPLAKQRRRAMPVYRLPERLYRIGPHPSLRYQLVHAGLR